MATYKSPSCKGTAHLLFLKLIVLCSQEVIENCFQKSSYFPSLPALCEAVMGLWVHETHDLQVRRKESLFAPAARLIHPFHFPPASILLSGCHWRFHVSLQRASAGFKFLSQSNFKRRPWLLTTGPPSPSVCLTVELDLNIQI